MIKYFQAWLSRRLLRERDKARDAGDKLAAAVFKADHEDLKPALRDYCRSEGWNGPIAGWLSKLFDECILCGKDIPLFRYPYIFTSKLDRSQLCAACERTPKL